MSEETVEKEWLPIGSVVLLEGGNVPILVVGRKVRALADGKEWDYVGVSYPEGFNDPEQMLLFDSPQLSSLLFLGLQTPRDKTFQHFLNEYDFEQIREAWPPKGYENPLMDVVR